MGSWKLRDAPLALRNFDLFPQREMSYMLVVSPQITHCCDTARTDPCAVSQEEIIFKMVHPWFKAEAGGAGEDTSAFCSLKKAHAFSRLSPREMASFPKRG